MGMQPGAAAKRVGERGDSFWVTHKMLLCVIVAVVVVCASVGGARGQTCPPEGFDSLKPFNLSAWVEHPWYIQEQMPVMYLTQDRFYCVRAQYEQTSENTVKVMNTAHVGSVSGRVVGGEFGLKAVIPDLDDSSKLEVGPEFLPEFLYGPYWVLFAGPSEDNYEYGIVSGGPPKNQGVNGCISGTPTDINDSGLWLFSKDPVADKETVAMLRSKAEELGFDLGVLLPVEQEGCTYSEPE